MRFFRRHQFTTNKYHAKITERDGIKFASKKEAQFYEELKIRKETGDVLFFLRQVPFHLPGGVRYVVDFMTFDSDGTVHFIDVKGMDTRISKTKRVMIESMYPVQIELR